MIFKREDPYRIIYFPGVVVNLYDAGIKEDDIKPSDIAENVGVYINRVLDNSIGILLINTHSIDEQYELLHQKRFIKELQDKINSSLRLRRFKFKTKSGLEKYIVIDYVSVYNAYNMIKDENVFTADNIDLHEEEFNEIVESDDKDFDEFREIVDKEYEDFFFNNFNVNNIDRKVFDKQDGPIISRFMDYYSELIENGDITDDDVSIYCQIAVCLFDGNESPTPIACIKNIKEL